MLFKPLTWLLAASTLSTAPGVAGAGERYPLLFATYAGGQNELQNTLLLVRSIREFGGAHARAPVQIYLPAELLEREAVLVAELRTLAAAFRTSSAPDTATWYYYAHKVYAAAEAEAAAEREATVLAWLDEDTILLEEPAEFLLPAGARLGYRPVMHRNICPHFDEPLDAFWKRAYQLMGVRDTTLFPMTTPAYGDQVRPYFNAGCLVVRPEHGLLREWPGYFERLYNDLELRAMAERDIKKRIFTHQVALTGVFLNHCPRGKMLEFSERINYPLFFKEMFGADLEFDDLAGIVTLRHESFFRNPPPNWRERLRGPAPQLTWLRENLP